MDLQEQIYHAPLDLKISVFCGIVALISFVYYSVEPSVGLLVLSIASPTALISLVTFFYRLIFGKLGVFSLVALSCIYITLLAIPFNAGAVISVALLFLFFSIISLAFRFVFCKKKEQTMEEKESSRIYASGMAITFAIFLFFVDCAVYSPLVLNNNSLMDSINNAKEQSIEEDVDAEAIVPESDDSKKLTTENIKVSDIGKEDAKKAVVRMQNIVDKKGYANIHITACSEDSALGYVALAKKDDADGFLIYSKSNNSLAWVEYKDNILNFINEKYSDNDYKPVIFNLELLEDKKDKANKDNDLGKWDGDMHIIPIHVLYEVNGGDVVPGNISSAKGNLKPSKFDTPLMEGSNVNFVDALLTNMVSLKRNRDLLSNGI